MLGFLKKTSCDTHEGPGEKDQYKDYNAALLSYFYALKYIPIDRSFKIATTNQWNDFCLSDTRGWFSILLQDSSSTCSHFVSKLRSRVGKTDVQMWQHIVVIQSGEQSTVPWSSRWQRVILASSASGPGWSSTCLHHWRGPRMLSSCSLALGLT